MHAPSTRPLENKLLASLPRSDFNALVEHFTDVSLAQGAVIFEVGDEVDHVYFPHNGMFSLLTVMRDGKAIETATVGREGTIGAMAGLGLYTSLVRTIVQLPTTATKISSPQFRKAAAANEAIRNLCIHYNEVLLAQARITAACNALHQVEARFCRWLLQSADRAGSDTVTLTQELLAEMLGVRRTTVTAIARSLQGLGVIRYTRGRIEISDRERLKKLACECYEVLRSQPGQILFRQKR